MLPVDRFTAYIQQNELFNSQMRVLAAVSGGMDSVLLAHLLKNAGYRFGIAHCNFMLRGAEADAEQQFCHLLAKNLEVPFYTINFDTAVYAAEQKISVQMAARELRYQWFEKIRTEHGYGAIVLAHHQNDAIETILLNLTRGTGIAGLHGILPKNNYLVRPLLFLHREDIAAIVTQNKLTYMEDSSNASTKYARNKLRHDVIPKLKELNPNLEQTFERSMAHFRALELLLQHQVALAKKEIWQEQGNEVHLSINAIRNLYPQRLLLLELLKGYGFNDTAIDDLLSALTKHSGRTFESGTHCLLLDRDVVILSAKGTIDLAPVIINEDDNHVTFGNKTFTLTKAEPGLPIQNNQNMAVVDADLLVYPLTIRTWQQGDSFVPLGMTGNKKLSDFFIQKKIPLHQKTQVPIVINKNNEIVWVAGYRLDNRYKLTPLTKKVTIFELL